MGFSIPWCDLLYYGFHGGIFSFTLITIIFSSISIHRFHHHPWMKTQCYFDDIQLTSTKGQCQIDYSAHVYIQNSIYNTSQNKMDCDVDYTWINNSFSIQNETTCFWNPASKKIVLKVDKIFGSEVLLTFSLFVLCYYLCAIVIFYRTRLEKKAAKQSQNALLETGPRTIQVSHDQVSHDQEEEDSHSFQTSISSTCSSYSKSSEDSLNNVPLVRKSLGDVFNSEIHDELNGQDQLLQKV